MLPLLPIMALLPFISIALAAIMQEKHSHTIVICASVAMFLIAFFSSYVVSSQGMQSLSFSAPYFANIGANLSFQYTNLSLILVVMSAIVFLAASIVGKFFITKDQKLYSIIFLLIMGGSFGLFLSANLFLFYVFWEIAEFAMFFVIFGYGGYDRRYAAMKFIIYSIAASLLLLIAIMLLYYNSNPHTFDLQQLSQTALAIPTQTQLIILVLLLLAFMIKTPIFPFHNWLPDAHTEAPTTGSMILAGVLLKFGGYGLLLTFLLVPIAANYSAYIAGIFGFSAIYGALVALKQTHLKRMIAYTSIVDMGIIGVGIAAINHFGTSGAIYGMLAHGLGISLLFLVAGTIERTYGTLFIDRLKGLLYSGPVLSYLFLFGILATIGLPLTSGFIGDILIFVGSYGAFGLAGLLPLLGILIAGAYFFWVAEKSFLDIKNKNERYGPIGTSVIISGVLLGVFTILLGIYPSLLLALSNL